MLCGHEGRTDEYRQFSTNDAGKRVAEVLVDYQRRTRGGEAYLRLFRFVPATHEIEARTYSPVLDKFETDDTSQFTLPWVIPDACRGKQAAATR